MIALRYLKRYWWVMAIVVILTVASTYFDLLVPECLSKLLNAVETEADFTNDAITMLAAVVASLLISLVVAYAFGYLLSSITYDIREDVFDKISSFSEAEMSKFPVGSLTTRTVNDVNRIRQVMYLMLIAFVKTPIMFAMALVKLTGMDLSWTLVLIAYCVAMITSMIIFLVTVVPMLRKLQSYMDEITTVGNDSLTGLCEIRSYSGESFRHDKYNAVNSKITDTSISVRQGTATLNALTPLCINTITAVIYLMAAATISTFTDARMQMDTFTDMIVFSTYASMVFNAIMSLFSAFVYYPQARIADRRIEEILTTEPSMKNGESSGEDEKGHVVFENVSFRYPGKTKDTLSGIDIELKPGQTLGIIGSTGCGKSTLVNLVARLYDVTGGSVKIDGTDVREYDIDALHSKIGFVPQKSMLLNRSVSDNVRLGDTYDLRTIEDVKEAVRIANAEDFVESQPDGYDHMVHEGGTNLSGGQRQRICIARAICRKPEIYVFDDCFSALDYRTDYLVRKALAEETAGVTTIIVSHRISTIINADVIAVMNNGRIIGKGTHTELMQCCSEYREIFDSQFPGGVSYD